MLPIAVTCALSPFVAKNNLFSDSCTTDSPSYDGKSGSLLLNEGVGLRAIIIRQIKNPIKIVDFLFSCIASPPTKIFLSI